MATEEELANIAAATTAPIIPFEASRRSVNYISNYVPDLSNRSDYTQIDLKKIIKSMDDFIKFVGYKPKDFDMTLLSELLTAPGDMTHFGLSDAIGDDFLPKINDIGVVKTEKQIGKILVDLINLEEDITIKTMNKLASAGLEANDISLFDKYNETIAHVIDQSMDNLKRLSGNLNSTPLEIATLMKQGKFAVITGADNDIMDIAVSMSEYVANAKIMLTRSVVPESVHTGGLMSGLLNIDPEDIKASDNAEGFVKNIEFDVGKNKKLVASNVQESLNAYKTFLVDRSKDYLNRTDNFYWRLTQPGAVLADQVFFADMVENIEGKLSSTLPNGVLITYRARVTDTGTEFVTPFKPSQSTVESIVKKKLPRPIDFFAVQPAQPTTPTNVVDDVNKLNQELNTKYADVIDNDYGLNFELRDGRLHITDMYLKDAERGKGIGSEIFDKIKQFADNNNLETSLYNDGDFNTTFWENKGFQEWSSKNNVDFANTPDDKVGLFILDATTAKFADEAVTILKPDISLKVRGTMHMTPAVTFIEKVQDAGLNLLVQNSRTGKLTPLSPVSMQTAGIDDTLNLWVAPNQDLKEAEAAIDTLLNKPLDRQGTSLTRDTAPKSKREVLDNVRKAFVDNHSEAALKTAEDIVKTKPKFASKVLKGLSKLDVGQEVIEKGLSKLGTKYGATAFTGPAAGILAFYETLVLAADVANAATKAIDKDVDFFDNFGEIDDKYSITYKLTKPFYETLFKGINNVTSNDNQDNEVQYSMESSK